MLFSSFAIIVTKQLT